MGKKILKLLITDIFIYLISFVFVYIGFNLLLPLVFYFIINKIKINKMHKLREKNLKQKEIPITFTFEIGEKK